MGCNSPQETKQHNTLYIYYFQKITIFHLTKKITNQPINTWLMWLMCGFPVGQKSPKNYGPESWLLPKSGVLNGTHGLVEPPKQTGRTIWKASLLLYWNPEKNLVEFGGSLHLAVGSDSKELITEIGSQELQNRAHCAHISTNQCLCVPLPSHC